MNTRFSYFVPGIFDPLEDPRTWDYQAQLWMHENGYGLSAGFNYFADILGGLLTRERYAAMAASDLFAAQSAALAPIIAVGHSNGGAILTDCLRDHPNVRIDELHLIAAAVNADCDASGLNLIAGRGQVKRVVLYVSASDEVLGLGPLVSYGTLGKTGPCNVSMALEKLLREVDRDCGHCDWVSRDFESTMQAIVGINEPPMNTDEHGSTGSGVTT